MKDLNEDRPGYKKTKVGWIPEEWGVVSIADVSKVFVSSVDKRNSLDEFDVFLCNYKDVYYNNYITHDLAFMKATASKSEIEKYRLKSGDVIITKDSETKEDIAVSASVREELTNVICGYHLAVIRPQENRINNDFLKEIFSLPYIKNSFSILANGVTRFGLTLNAIGSASIPLPPLTEQRKIAEILSTWDEAIDQIRKQIDAKKKRKKGLMQQLLTGKKRIVRLDKDWGWPRASEVFYLVALRSSGEEPVLAVTQNNGVVDRSTLDKRIEYNKENLKNYKIVEPGDFVISLRSFQGGLELSPVRGRVSPAYHVIRNKISVSQDFYRYYYKSYEFIGRLAIAVIGIRDGKQVNLSDFKFLRIPLPSLEEQTAIAAVLQTADEEISLLESELSALEEQKRGLMQKLLTGTVRVKV